MATLILIRHGQSEGNRDRIFTPNPEVPITDTGREQVRAAAAWIRARHVPAHVVTSPFRRARQTADIIAGELGLEVSVEPDLRERSYGALAGQPYTAAVSCPGYDPVTYWTWCPPGDGETLVDVAGRAGAALDRVARTLPDRDVIVVSHGAVMTGLWWHVTGVWRQGRVARNAGIILVEHEGGRYLGAVAVEDRAG